jgi:hypothetical protein
MSEEDGLADGFVSMRNAQPYIPMPVNMPAREKLTATSRYIGLDDLTGVEVDELVHHANISRHIAPSIVTLAAQALTARSPSLSALALDFPARAALFTAGYPTPESLAGHTLEDLQRIPGVSEAEATSILERLA